MEEPSSEADESVKSIENDKVASILNQVSQLSELDKYMLYLQLPTEETADDGIDDTSKAPLTLMAKRIDAAVKWIRQNYTDTHDQSVFLPKEEFYEHYREECEVEDSKPLSIADFGKVIKLVFPKIAQRRLGQRGKSRYGYEGLKKKEGNTSSTCTACNRDLTEKPSPDVHLYTLSCQIVCEWASQLLDRQLSDIKSLSEYLVSKGFSYGKAAAKFSLLSGSSGHHKQLEKDRKSPRFQDGQVLLQRKLLQKEIIRQHKQKLQEQQKFQRELAKTSPLNLTHSGAGGRKHRNQPRPSSVQSYTPSWSSNQINSSYGFLTSGQAMPLSEAHSNAAQASSRLMGILVSGGQDSLTPMKRCQSASVVEKYSDSSNVLDLFQERDAISKQKLLSAQNPAFSSPSMTSDSTDTIMSSPAITRGNSRAGNSRLETLLSQHYKRNGDNISPDGETKRRCMTSLGVREQENLNPIHLSDDNELTRLRPYSCPVICSDQGQVKPAGQEEAKKCKTSDDGVMSEMWPVKLRCDKKDTKRETQENKIHFVQKPTVINGRINNLHNVVSCPDFQQFTKNADTSPGDVRHSRPSSNILNSLLSSDLDLLWRKSGELKADRLSASRPHSLASSVSDLSTLTNHQLRVITDPSNSSESAVKLSNQSSRSAFVPVTSHKQSHIGSSTQQETKLSQHFPPFTLSKDSEPSLFHSAEQSCKSSTDSLDTSYVDKIFLDHLDHPFYSNGSIFSHTVSPSVNASTEETLEKASLFNQDSPTFHLVNDTLRPQKQIPDTVLYMSQASCQPHLVVASAVPTTSYSTSPVTRISTSTVSSPVVSTSSPVSSTHTAFVMTPPPRNVSAITSVISPNTSSTTINIISTSPVSSTTCSSSTSQVSSSNSSTLTPPKRVSKNRFTPIRPKLGGSRSPQFTTTPSPTKKDMRPVSALLKEQRGFKIAKGLLVNLGNNYQGEVKFQMPAEILCLAPGKSKTSDLLVTINPSNSIPSSKNYSLTTNSSPLLWPLTIPTQQVKSSDSLTSPVLTQPANSFLTGGSSQPNINDSGVQLVTDINPSTPGLPIALCSPRTSHHRNTGTTASACVNKQLIILSPTKSVKGGDRSANCVQPVGDHRELYGHAMSTNGQNDQKVDSVLSHGLDTVNDNRPIESFRANEQSFSLTFDTNVLKMEEAQTTSSVTSQAEFEGDKEVRSSVQFSDENLDNLMLNQNTMPHHKLYNQDMSTSGQHIDQNVDLITFHGLDTVNEKRPIGSPRPNRQSFSLSYNANSTKTEEALTTSSITSQAEFKGGKEVRPSVQFSDENFDKLMLNQKTMSLSSTLLSELSQLVSAAHQPVSAGHQPSIQHRSSPSAFYKCSNQQLKPSDNPVKNLLSQAILTNNVNTNSVSFPLQAVENSNAQASQLVRKRKVGGEDHGKKKKMNRSMKKELDDDVFIINIEDSVNLPNGKDNTVDGMQSEKLDDKSSADGSKSDTDKLLGMLPNKESLTVKETVKALNDLRAKMVCGTQSLGGATHVKADLGACKTAVALSTLGALQSCSSEASMFKSDKVSPGSEMGQPCARDGKSVSLNVESLESDALLDHDQAWSLHLVSEMADGIKEQKTSVGVAAKSASKTVKHIVSRQVPDPTSMYPNMMTMNSVGKMQHCSVSPKTENCRTETTSSNGSKPKVAARKKTLVNLDKGPAQLNQIDLLNKQITTQEPIRRSSMTNIELKSPNVQRPSAPNGKASNHPTLAQYLTVSTPDKGVAPVRSFSLTSEMESEHELPGDILDFITESTCYRSSFYSDMYKTDKFEHSSTLLRSLSAPNTLALAHQASHSARVNDIKVSLADHESNLYDLDCDTPGANPHRTSQGQSSGIFLSPVGTAKMNRRLSMERSVASDSSVTKSVGDSKANSDRPPSRLKGSVDKCKVPVDRLISKLLTDKIARPVWGRDSGGHGKEEAYAEVQQGQVSSVKGNLADSDKDFIKLLDQRLFGGFTCSTSTEAGKPDTDRSSNHTPLSDGGYGSITQTPVSDVSSISPSPVMMASTSYFGEAERRDILSPATIFMPLRSENSSRNAADNGPISRTNRTADVNNYTTKLLHFLDSSKMISKNLVQTGLDPAGATKSGRSVNSTSLQDLTTQIHCIPTPPSSPSNCHSNEANHSSLNAGSETKNAHFGQAYLTNSVAKDNQGANVETNTNHQSKSSPKVSSPKIAPVTSPLPHGHPRTQMYNPHPSPPFTPSSQLCLASPRCPTPCQLTSSGCTTPISDSNGAPNRFVPIQTSGILGNSAVGYIQPIRPVVTNVANMHTKSLLASQMKAKPQELPNFLNSEPEQHTSSNNSNTNTSQRKDHQNCERHVTVPPALVLSLTGGIGSVSGRGMKDGWGGHEMSQAATGYPSQVVVKQELDQPDTMSTSMHLSNDMLPTYEEAISLLVGSQNNFNNAPEAPKKTGGISESNSGDQLSGHSPPVSTQQTEGSKSMPQSAPGISHVPQQSGQKKDAGDKTKSMTIETFLNMVAKNDKMQFSHQSSVPHTHSVVTSKKQPSDSSLRQLLSSKTSSLSTMLQAPAFSTVYPKSVPLEAAGKVQISSDSSKLAKETNRRKSSSNLNEQFTTKWNSPEVADSFQISDLPSACYSGTTPNKTAPDVSSYGSLPAFLDQQPHHQHLMGMNFSSEMEHLRQDDLDETLDVLKNIDSQYFQADEDEMV